MEIKLLRPTDVDYPIIMKLVPFADKYDLMKIDDLIVVPLLQVFDAISEVKADIDVKNGVECCPTCGKPIKGIFTKDEVITMLTDIQLEIEELEEEADIGKVVMIGAMDRLIQQKIDLLQKRTTNNCDNCFNGTTKGGCAVKELMKNKDCKYYMPRENQLTKGEIV